MVGPGVRVFGKYEVVRRLAVGGMGEIFLSRQTGVVDRLVILKSLLPQLAADDQALAQFLDEARILGSINHPNVCALLDVGEYEDQYFIAMEYINGVDVSHLLKFCEDNKKRLPPLTSAHIVREAALGLDAAHVATDATGSPLRVVHRDISPHNLMVRSDGLTKVVDFGVAVAENRLQKTEVGLLKGKLGYMAPEQIKGAPVEPKADQFSLGVLFWEMLTQRRLFVGESAAQVFMRILKEKIPAPSTLVGDVPKELDTIVLRMTAQEPVERFARLSDAATALRRVLEQYKSPDNAAQQLIRATVGGELQARLKELASTPRVEAPVRNQPSTSTPPQSANGSNPPGSASGTPSASSASFCGSCGTPAQGGDRFCRVCGSAVTPLGATGTPAATPAPQGTPAATTRVPTGVVPRVDVMGATSVRTGVVRKDDSNPGAGSGTGPAVNNPFLGPKGSLPLNMGATPLGTPSNVVLPTVELAVVSGLVEMLKNGQVVAADEEARKAAFAVVDDLAARHHSVAEKHASGRFSLAFVGDGAITTAVALARANVRAAARAGHDVLLRLGVAADTTAVEQLNRLKQMGEVLVDNCAPGSAVIVDLARVKGGEPPTTRSASVPMRDGTSVIAHELALPRRLVGRATEVAVLDTALDEVEHQKRARQVMLLGDGGIGKTALLEVGLAFARDRGFLCGFARGARVAEPLALDVLRQLVRTVSLELLARERLSGAWTRAVDLCGLSPAYAARIKAVIDDEGDNALQDVPAPRRRAVLKASVLAFFEKLAERAPIGLFVDDLHKGDSQSFELLAELAARLGEHRVAVITAGRPVQGERVLPMAKRVTLTTLSPADVVAVGGLLLGAPVLEPLAGFLVSRSLGNPLVLTLVLRQLATMRALAANSMGMTVNGDVDKLGLPPNPTVLIHANHATLPAEAQTLLLAAAHLGQVFEPAQLFRIADGVRDIAGTLRGLAEMGIIEPLANDQWAFRSTVELETIPARIEAMQGRRLQQRVADALGKDIEGRFTIEAGERLVVHLTAAEARPRAAEVSALVAARASGLGLFELAADHHKRALAHDWKLLSSQPGDEDKAARVLRSAAAATAAMAEVDAAAAIDIAAPVLKSVPPLLAIHARVEALRQRGLAFARAKRFSEAENCLDEALETLQSQADEAVAGGVLIDLASVLEQRGDADSALSQLQEALRLLSRVPGIRERAYDGLLLLGRLGLRQRQFEPARQAFAAAIEEARRAGRVAAEAEARALMGALQQAQGNLDAAVVDTEGAISLAEQVGDPVLEARLHQQLGRTLVALGRRGDAAAALSKALDRARRGQWDEGVSAAQQLLAVVGG
jgi:serine/threonine protein kinase/tetratricopeptide (TPR) repeat protein